MTLRGLELWKATAAALGWERRVEDDDMSSRYPEFWVHPQVNRMWIKPGEIAWHESASLALRDVAPGLPKKWRHGRHVPNLD